MRRALEGSRIRLAAAVIGVVSLTATACIADETDPSVAIVANGGSVTIVMDEYSFSPPRLHLDAGSTISVTLVNEGSVDHELMIGQAPQAGGGYGNDLLALMLPGESVASPTDGDDHEDTNMAVHSDGAAADHDDTATPVHDDGGAAADHDDTATTVHDDGGAAADHDDTATTVHDDGGGSSVEGGHDDVMGHGGGHVTVSPGETMELTLTVPLDASGEWELGCFIDTHYEEGMKGFLTVRQSVA